MFYLHNGVEHRSIPWTVPFIAAIAQNEGTILIQRLDGRLNTAQYIRFLGELTTAAAIDDVSCRPFAHDFNFVHRSAAVQHWIAGQPFLQQQPWSRSSPDLMPLTEVFDEMVETLNRRYRSPAHRFENEDAIWQEISSVWDELSFLVLPPIWHTQRTLNTIREANPQV